MNKLIMSHSNRHEREYTPLETSNLLSRYRASEVVILRSLPTRRISTLKTLGNIFWGTLSRINLGNPSLEKYH